MCKGLPQEFHAVRAPVAGIRVGEEVADVAERKCAEQRVDQRMDGDIRVAVSQKPFFMRQFHAA